MARPQAPVSVTVLGECVADAFIDPARSSSDELALRALPGGGPANTAVALARLGTPTRFLGRFSTDVFGTLFRARLSASGVDLTGSVTAPEPSTLAVADLDETGQATYTFHAENAADWQWTDEELATTGWDGAACLHTGSLALIRQPGGTSVEDHLAKAREHVTVSIDPNVRPLLVPPAAYRERLPHWCALADILRLSEDDLGLLLPGVSPEEACDTWHAALRAPRRHHLGRTGRPRLPRRTPRHRPGPCRRRRRHRRRRRLLHRGPAPPPRSPRTPRRPPRPTEPRRPHRRLPLRRPRRRPDLLSPRSEPAPGGRSGAGCRRGTAPAACLNRACPFPQTRLREPASNPNGRNPVRAVALASSWVRGRRAGEPSGA